MKSNLSKVVAEYLVKKLTQAGWQLTYGTWKEFFLQNIGQELVWEDERRLIIVSYPNLFLLDVNPYKHISILLNDKLQKKMLNLHLILIMKMN